jgi:hypothetical protein
MKGFFEDHPYFLPIFFTTVYLCFLAGFFANSESGFNRLSLNEIGDVLAGFVGPVALMWIVIGYSQQNKAIGIQAKELKAAVDQHQAQVKATSALVDHELRRARIDYYRLVSEASSKIQQCKLLLYGDLESEETRNRSSARRGAVLFRINQDMANVARSYQKTLNQMVKQLNAGLGIPEGSLEIIETKEILEKALAKTSEEQAQFEKEIEDYAKIKFDMLERRFSQIVIHIGKAQALYDRIELYLQSERAKEAAEIIQKSKTENEKTNPDDRPS